MIAEIVIKNRMNVENLFTSGFSDNYRIPYVKILLMSTCTVLDIHFLITLIMIAQVYGICLVFNGACIYEHVNIVF